MPPEYQQMLNQVQQQQQQNVLLVIIIQIALFVVGAWVIYMHQTRTLGAHLLDSTLHHLLAA